MTARLYALPYAEPVRLAIDLPPVRDDDRPLCKTCLRPSSILGEGSFYCGACALERWGAFFYDEVLG